MAFAASNLPSHVSVYEMSARDGLQNESAQVATHAKVRLIDALVDAGITRLEVGSFVSPRWVPQMADADEVCRMIERKPGVSYSCPCPNARGLQRALAADSGIAMVAVVHCETTSGIMNPIEEIGESEGRATDLVDDLERLLSAVVGDQGKAELHEDADALGVAVIETNRRGFLPPGIAEHVPDKHFDAILWAFTLLLLAEVISLIFALAQSVATAVGKQLEIMSLILLRQSFKELTDLPEPIVWKPMLPPRPMAG